MFDSLPFAGTSWAPETANANTGEFILGERPKGDGTSLLLEAFVEAVITQKQPERIAEKATMLVCSVCWATRLWRKKKRFTFLMNTKLTI